jgi:protein TonB
MPTIKNYRADLRGKYRKYFEISLILSLSLIIASFKLAPIVGNMDENIIIPQELITIENIINTVQKTKPPELPVRPKIIELQTDEVIEDLVLDDISIDQDADLGDPPLISDRPKTVDDEPFINWAEEMPEPIGGIGAIQKKAYYTEIAKRMGIEGKVIVEAMIDKNGNVTDANLIRDIGGGLGEVAINAVKNTRFKPGKQRGKPVKVKMKIPIKFVLR